MASSSFARDQATRRLRAAAAAAAAAPAAVATNPLFSWGTPTALIGTGSSCPGAMWHSTATGSRSDSESDEEDLPVGDEVCKHGYLRKQKHGHKRYFVLKLETADAPARLEYYENARKFRHSVRAAAAAAAAAASGAAVPALIPPRRVITLYQCFSVSQRADAKYRHLIALFTQDEYFAMVAENESEQESWYLLLSRLILESKRRRCGTLSAQPDREPAALAAAAEVEPPFYKDVWQVVVKPRGLGHRKELSGVFRLCLTDEEVVFVRLNSEVASVVVQLLSIRRCGHSEQYFFLEVGRSTVIGPGELWMQVDDCVVAQHMHELFLEKMRALCADEYRARCRSYSVNIGAHLLTLLSTRRHLGLLPLEPGGWLRRSRLDQFCHLRALGDGEDEMLVTRRYVTPSEPIPAGRRGRLQLPRARRSRRALSVPASLFRRLPSSPVCAPQREEAPSDRASLSAEASGAGTGNPAEEDSSPSREGQEDSGDDYMPMHSWSSGNGRDSGGGHGSSGQGPSSQSSGAGQCSGGRQGSGGGQGTSGHQGSGDGQGSGGQGAGGNQCSRDGQGAAGGHAAGGGGASGGQGSGGGHGSGGGQGPGDGRGSGSGKDSGRGKGSGSGKGSNGDGDRDRGKSLKKRSYFGKLSQSKPLLPPPPPPPSPPGAGAISAKAKSGGRFRLYFCADRGATKERKEAKELKDGEIPDGAARVPYRARAFDEDEDDPYVPMRPGVAAPLVSSSDYMPMAPQNASASQKRHSRSPFEDSRGYMMMFPTTSPPPAPSPPKAGDLNKDDESKDDSDSDYMFMAPGAGAVPKNPQNPQGGASSRSWNSYFSLPNPFRNSPLGQSDHSSNANEEEGDYIEVIFNPAMTPAVPFADSAIRYDAETGRIYVVDPFSECCMDVALSPSPCSDPPPVARLLQEEEQGRRHPPSRPETLFAAARAAVSAFPTDSLDRDLSASSASAAAPTLAVGRALAAASALAAAPGIGSAAAGFEAAAGVDSARWFQPVAAASASAAAAAAAEADADALRGAQNFAGGSNPGAPNPFADLAGADNRAGQAAAAAAAPTPPPRRRRMPRPPERADSDGDNDDDDTYVTMDFARLDNKKFDSTKRD